ncbi:E3 ubiquitin-protein ligase FANCL [Chloropicon primus]|uniref:E3 ubiquitin-protein ligase FANCL n=1 Tax=Chloropicon primus TaxID=1764295 RepID=A0A5B8MNM3_9CHLO|nr:E3 ubiquitin-protein ligase FANCL [Chloropicon primus]|eukprot:QDZ22089.1 E3 ubiquitin-protein ligase FANCL [Chloropicon primus]
MSTRTRHEDEEGARSKRRKQQTRNRDAEKEKDAKRRRATGGETGKWKWKWKWNPGDLQRLRVDFPGILPREVDGTRYEGYLSVRRRAYWISLSGIPPLKGQAKEGTTVRGREESTHSPAVSVRLCEELERVLTSTRKKEEVFERRLRESRSLHGFLVEVSTMVEKAVWKETSSTPAASASASIRLAEELREIGASGGVAMEAKDLSFIQFKVKDVLGRDHAMGARISAAYPREAPKLFAKLPIPLVPDGKDGGGGGWLKAAVSTFQRVVRDLHPFWKLMSGLERAVVLEGAAGDAHRRVAVSRSVSLHVEFPEPLAPLPFTPSNPAITLLGPAGEVTGLETKISAFWAGHPSGTPETDLVGLLESMLGARLPLSSGAGSGSPEADKPICGICYSDILGGISCENPKCDYLFHKECLLEWLQSDQSSRQTFNTWFGVCPYCSDPIVCKTVL